MDIGQAGPLKSGDAEGTAVIFKPFARPKRKRRRVAPSKPSVFAVRPNPSHYVLDLSEKSKSIERAVCSLVLSDIRAVSIVGLPGTGKSVILRSVAYHPSVFTAFRDGICLVQVGPETSVALMFVYLFEVMVKLGGISQKEEVEKVFHSGNHAKAMDMIHLFLREKRFLLILDNVCEEAAEVHKLLSMLATTRPSRGQGRLSLLTSTRSVELARSFGGTSVLHVREHDPCGDTSRDILCAHAGFERSYFDTTCRRKNNSAIDVLRKCSGLSLSLAVAGGAIKRLLKGTMSEEAKDMIWRHYKTYLYNNYEQFGEISGLFKGISLCANCVIKGEDWKAVISVSDALCSLSILQKGVWIPYHILQRLWGIKRKDDVINVVRPLSRLCLVRREARRGGVGVAIPDIVSEFCLHEAKKKNTLKKWHLKLLSTYVERGSAGGVGMGTETSYDEDQYLQENLAHHVSQAMSSVANDSVESKLLTAASTVIENKLMQKYERKEQKA